jgi:hypothetical protein
VDANTRVGLCLFSSFFVPGLLHSSWSGWLVTLVYRAGLSVLLAARNSLDLGRVW